MVKNADNFSKAVISRNHLLTSLLDQLGLSSLKQLDPDKLYAINIYSGKVRIYDPKEEQPASEVNDDSFQAQSVTSLLGFGSGTSTIQATSGPGGSIVGEARTIITCPFGGQTAEVRGFMASQQSRDPVSAPFREGVIVSDNMLTTVAEVDFSIPKLLGGAKNPSNRTTLDSIHEGFCGDELIVRNLVATWPPLRVQMVLDDTGSMGDELSGVKSALASYVANVSASATTTGRDTFFEVVSFKDSPSLRIAKTDHAQATISAVNGLFPSGGGNCPEDSIGALNYSLNSIANEEFESNASILLVTDASPHEGSDIAATIALAQSLGVSINVLLSGDCVESASAALAGTIDDSQEASSSNNGDTKKALAQGVSVLAAVQSAREVFEQIANETGGSYSYLPDSGSVTPEDYADILEGIFEDLDDPEGGSNFECEQRILSSWGSMSYVEIKITNVSNEPRGDWAVVASYPNGYSVGQVFQIDIEGSNPATFTPPSYLEALEPQEHHTFLYFVNDGGMPVDATLTRCGN